MQQLREEVNSSTLIVILTPRISHHSICRAARTRPRGKCLLATIMTRHPRRQSMSKASSIMQVGHWGRRWETAVMGTLTRTWSALSRRQKVATIRSSSAQFRVRSRHLCSVIKILLQAALRVINTSNRRQKVSKLRFRPFQSLQCQRVPAKGWIRL